MDNPTLASKTTMRQFLNRGDLPAAVRPWHGLIRAAFCGADTLVSFELRQNPPSPPARETALLAALAGAHEKPLKRLLDGVDFVLPTAFYREAGRILTCDETESSRLSPAKRQCVLLLVGRQPALREKISACHGLTMDTHCINLKGLLAEYLREQMAS